MKFEKLKNIVEVKKGKKPSLVDTPDENSVRVLQIDDLRNDTNPKFTNDKTGVFAKEDDVLIAWDGANAGTIGYGKSGYIGSTIALLRKKQPDLYSTTFIGIFLQSQYQYLRSKTTGATIPHISRKALDELEVPVISVNDQIHIANLLSKAENLIAQRKESIRLLDEFLNSTFLQMFGDPVRNEKGWKTKLLNQLVDKLGDGLHGTPVYDDSGEYFFINGNNLEKGFIRTDVKTKRVSYEEYTKHSKELNENTILVSINGTLGRVAFYRGEKIILGKSACYFNLIKGSIDSLFLFHFLQSEFFLKYVTNKATGSTISNVSLKTMRELPIIIPPPILQTQFAQIVEKTEALKIQYQQSLQELENLYGSLSQRAFRGELTKKEKYE